jgi:hypothetical protein
MEFREAVAVLGQTVTTAEIADAAGVSVDSVRQARLRPGGSGYRPPPQGWRDVVIRLAEERIRRLEQLVKELRG